MVLKMAAHMRHILWRTLLFERHAVLKSRNTYTFESKRYVRGPRRTPVKVLFPNSDLGNISGLPKTKTARHSNKTERVRQSNASFKGKLSDERSTSNKLRGTDGNVSCVEHDAMTTENHVGRLRFDRALPGDKRLSRVVSVARSRTFRGHQGKILLEGRRLICDALEAGANPQMVFFSTVDRLHELPEDKLRRATLVKVKFEDIKIWSHLVAPQGVIAIFSRPDPLKMKFPQTGQSIPLSLICDNIRDPGNLGTILRCAAAAGCSDVLLTKGCVDPWEPKVLRAAMGAHFRLPIFPSMSWKDVENHLPKPVSVHVADNSRDTERGGIDYHINMPNNPSKTGDYGWQSTKHNHKNMCYDEFDTDSDDYTGPSLPILDTRLYHERWAHGPTALVIGGETNGVSLEAAELAEKTSGQRLFIPLVPEVDSLNSAMAASILVFEGRKQMLNLTIRSRGKAKV